MCHEVNKACAAFLDRILFLVLGLAFGALLPGQKRLRRKRLDTASREQ